jgi:hypothetical protein
LFKGFQAFKNATRTAEDTTSDHESEYEGAGQYDEDESEDDEEAGQPILPIFSAPILGMSTRVSNS